MKDDDKQTFKKISNYIFSNNIRKYIILHPIKNNPLSSEEDKNDKTTQIKDIEFNFRYEVAPVNNRLHLHGVICIVHNGKVKLDYDLLRKVVNASFVNDVHINIQASGDLARGWLDYINKTKNTRKVVEL